MLILILLHVAVAAFLVYWFLRRGRGRREPVKALIEAAGMGLLAIIIAVILEAVVLGNPGAYSGFAAHGARAALWAAVAFWLVGVIEELAKLLPLAWFVYKRPYFTEHTDGIIYFSFAGLAFGLVENILYTVSLGAGAGIVRLVLMPYFHAALTGIAGFYLASHKIRKISTARVVLAVTVLIFLHATYDFLLVSGSVWLVLLALPVLAVIVFGLFWYMRRAKKLDQQLGLETAPAATTPVVASVAPPGSDGKSTAALVLGIIALITWLFPIVGLPVSFTALVLGISNRNSNRKGQAVAGVVMACLSIPLLLFSALVWFQVITTSH